MVKRQVIVSYEIVTTCEDYTTAFEIEKSKLSIRELINNVNNFVSATRGQRDSKK